jgi:hypothetical protein
MAFQQAKDITHVEAPSSITVRQMFLSETTTCIWNAS